MIDSYEVTFEDSGIHNEIIVIIPAIDWNDIENAVQLELKNIIRMGRLNHSHAYVSHIRRIAP
jgi:hypothetical protein